MLYSKYKVFFNKTLMDNICYFSSLGKLMGKLIITLG